MKKKIIALCMAALAAIALMSCGSDKNKEAEAAAPPETIESEVTPEAPAETPEAPAETPAPPAEQPVDPAAEPPADAAVSDAPTEEPAPADVPAEDGSGTDTAEEPSAE